MGSSARKVSFEVVEEDAGRRLDQVLAARIPELSRRKARVLLDIGGVFVERVRVKVASRKVRPGQRIEVHLGGALERAHKAVGRRARARDAQALPDFEILFEDGDVVVVDKPAGLLTAPTPESDRGNLADALQRSGARQRIYVVHRIDMGTSGILVLGKTRRANKELSEQFRRHDVVREYVAVLAGALGQSDGAELSIDLPISGRKATTHLRVAERLGQRATVVHARLETGRTHQIRIHCRHLGHPVLGDRRYGRRTGHDPSRMALHAATLGFVHPRSGERMTFSSPLPDELVSWIDGLRPGLQPQEKSMIERYVYIRLKPEHTGERETIAARARELLPRLPGVVSAAVGLPADEHADKAWDLGFAVRFQSIDDVEGYRTHPEHRQFVDDYLQPRTKVIKAWNFAMPEG